MNDQLLMKKKETFLLSLPVSLLHVTFFGHLLSVFKSDVKTGGNSLSDKKEETDLRYSSRVTFDIRLFIKFQVHFVYVLFKSFFTTKTEVMNEEVTKKKKINVEQKKDPLFS